MDSTDAPQIIELVNKSLPFTPYDAKWVPCSARVVTMGITPKAKGALSVYEVNGGDVKLVKETQTLHGIKCGTFGASDLGSRQIATGDFGGLVNIWDLETMKSVYNVQAHGAIINSIDGAGGMDTGNSQFGAPELVTGSRDGAVKVWDVRIKEPVLSLEPEEGQPIRDCWTVCFGNSYNDDERCIAAGYDNGDIKIFDLRTNQMKYETNVANGVTSIEFDKKDIEMNKMAVSTLESKFRLYDMRIFHPEDGYSHVSTKAHKSTVWIARFLPQNREIFMTGGGNGGFNIYRYHNPLKREGTHAKDGLPIGNLGRVELLNSRVISTQPLVSLDWSPDREGLCALTCLDQTLRVSVVTRLHKY